MSNSHYFLFCFSQETPYYKFSVSDQLNIWCISLLAFHISGMEGKDYSIKKSGKDHPVKKVKLRLKVFF